MHSFGLVVAVLLCVTMAAPRSPFSMQASLIKKSMKLKDNGKKCMSANDHNSASLCYSAACQALAGLGGSRPAQIRQECGLALTECLHESDKPLQCVSAATAVISESTEKSSSSGIMRAYYFRAASLHQIGMDEFSALDAERAFSMLSPKDADYRRIYSLLEKVKHCLPVMDAVRLQFVDVVDDIAFANTPRTATEEEMNHLSQHQFIASDSLIEQGPFASVPFALKRPSTRVTLLSAFMKLFWFVQKVISLISGVRAIIKKNSSLVSLMVTVALGLQILLDMI